MTKKIILGSMESDAPADIVTLHGAVTANKYETLQTKRTATGEAGADYYQVPTGYELVITNVSLRGTVGETAVVTLGYGDNAVASGSVAPINAVGLCTSGILATTAVNAIEQISVCLKVPAGKYPYFLGWTVADIMVSGFLHRM